MNNARRKLLAKILDDAAPIAGLIEDIKARLEEIKDAEREAYDNMPASLQEGERGQQASAAADALDEAFDELEEAFNAFDNLAGHIETASE